MLGFTNKIADSLNQYIDNYQQTEGGIDYNAGLVGALAYINSKLNPVDTSSLGSAGIRRGTSSVPHRLLVSALSQGISIEAPFAPILATVEAIDLRGRRTRLVGGSSRVTWKAVPGTWILRATDISGSIYQTTVVVQ